MPWGFELSNVMLFSRYVSINIAYINIHTCLNTHTHTRARARARETDKQTYNSKQIFVHKAHGYRHLPKILYETSGEVSKTRVFVRCVAIFVKSL